ncbi:MAG: cytochrome c biogenesis CcdA family protein [Gemmatimonadota bacterium]
MTLDITAIPIAFFAGVVGVLSPCVWPLVPVVMASAATGGRRGPYFLAGGLAIAFAFAGTFLTFILVSTGTDPEFFRYFAATLLIAMGGLLIVKRLGDWVSTGLSRFTAGLNRGGRIRPAVGGGEFGVGLLLGVVWLPCVGPTLGVAIALASFGEDFLRSFFVMLSYGVGTGGVLLTAGVLSGGFLARRKALSATAGALGKKILGWSVLLLGLAVLTGMDKRLEALAVDLLPSWIFSL